MEKILLWGIENIIDWSLLLKPHLGVPHRSFFRVWMFLKKKLIRNKSNWSNLTTSDQAEIKSLTEDKTVVVTRMDKSAGFVFLNFIDYIKIGLKIFNNQSAFINVTNKINPADKLIKLQKLNNNIFRKMLKDRVVNQLIFNQSQIPCFQFSKTYLLIKTHKPLDVDNHYPARPIISGHNTTFKFLDSFLEFILYPLLSKIPSKIHNNLQLLSRIKDLKFCRDTTFTTFDVVDMYPSIDQFVCASKVEITVSENVGLLTHHLNCVSLILPEPKFIKFLILVVLRNSVFTFISQYFQRSKGISMGSNISVLLADIFIWRTVEQGLYLHHLMNIRLWGRFIDDIIVVSNSPLFDSDLVLTKLHIGTN